MDKALTYLNELVDNGVEFPDAITKVLKRYKVNQKKLTQMYDEQF